jgi:hypothetical protein
MWQSNRWLNYESIRGNGPLHPIAFGIVLAAALTTALERRKRPLSVCISLSSVTEAHISFSWRINPRSKIASSCAGDPV